METLAIAKKTGLVQVVFVTIFLLLPLIPALLNIYGVINFTPFGEMNYEASIVDQYTLAGSWSIFIWLALFVIGFIWVKWPSET
jgi:hypothetical protein